MSRHPQLKTKCVPPLDKEGALAQDPAFLQGWSDLFEAMKAKYNIQEGDIYNMDEKGFMMGVIAKLKVMISKYEKKGYMTVLSAQRFILSCSRQSKHPGSSFWADVCVFCGSARWLKQRTPS